MELKQVKERIAKKEDQISKIEKRIAKWEKANSEAGFIKEYASWVSTNPKEIVTMNDLIDARAEYDPEGDARRWVESNYEDYLKGCEKEIKYAERDLEEAKVQLDKYKNQLNALEDKANTKKVQIIVDFLNDWKKKVSDYIHENVVYVDEYYSLNSEICDLHNNRYKYLETMTLEEYKQKERELKDKEEAAKSNIHPITTQVYWRGTINEEALDKILEREKEAKYWNMIERVTEVTGEISDASNLRMGMDGNLNGYIIGDKGTAKLETIGAGGYNIQCYHYRLLVHKVK